jgi:hypothetical protein
VFIGSSDQGTRATAADATVNRNRAAGCASIGVSAVAAIVARPAFFAEFRSGIKLDHGAFELTIFYDNQVPAFGGCLRALLLRGSEFVRHGGHRTLEESTKIPPLIRSAQKCLILQRRQG